MCGVVHGEQRADEEQGKSCVPQPVALAVLVSYFCMTGMSRPVSSQISYLFTVSDLKDADFFKIMLNSIGPPIPLLL